MVGIRGNIMKKSVIIVLVAAITIALGLSLVPNAISQTEDIEILSYSWYISPYSSDTLIVVGEVQNTGSDIIDYVSVAGTFYATDGTALMYNYNKALVTQILPDQKAPFYLYFSSSNSLTGDYSWGSENMGNFTLTVAYAVTTESSQYQGLEITSHSASTDSDGYYCITGTVKNTGSQSTNQTWVVATFYNSTGSVVAIGYTETFLTPTSISPGGTASFTIYPTDYASVVSAISSYSLQIQTRNTAPTATPTASPGSTTSSTPTATSSSATPTPTGDGSGTAIPETYVYAAVAIVAIIVVVGVVALVLKKRSGKHAAVAPVNEMDKETQPPQ
jgi:hypothetical protein